MKTNRFLGNISSDFYKIARMKSLYIIPIVMFFMILINYALLWTSEHLFSMTAGSTDDLIGMLTGKSLLFMATSNGSLGFLIAIVLCIFIGGEFSTGMIKTSVARGTSKYQIYFSKLIVMSAIVVFYSLFCFLISGIFTSINGYGTVFDVVEFGLVMRSLALQILVNISVGSVYVMIAFLMRSKGSAICTSIAILFFSSLIVGIFFSISIIAASNSADWLGEAIKYIPSQQIGTACSFSEISTPNLMRVIFVPIAYIIGTSFIGILSFVKRDIK